MILVYSKIMVRQFLLYIKLLYIRNNATLRCTRKVVFTLQAAGPMKVLPQINAIKNHTPML